MRRARGILLAILTLTPVGALAAQQPARGPLTTEEGAPLQRLSFMATMESADVTEPGALRADMWLGLSNIFEQDSSATHVLLLDMERLITAVTLRWGVADAVELGGRLTFETTGGGILDSFVHWYHERLGFGQANRDRFPRDGYSSRLGDGGGTVYLDGTPRTLGLDDARVFVKWRAAASADRRNLLSLKAIGWIPVHSHRVGERRPGLALTGLGRLGVGSWYLHGMLGLHTPRAAPPLDEVVRDVSASFSVGVERSLGPSVSAVAQYQIVSPVLRGFRHRELDGVASNILFGLAGRWGPDWTWDVGFQEDLPSDTPAIDFTLGVRVSRVWR